MSLEMFTRYAPQEWQKLHQEGQPIPQVHELARLVSLNARLSQADVATIYAPMIHYLDMMMTYQQAYQSAKYQFLQGQNHPSLQSHQPFVIGISGSVAVGKSTTARVLHELLSRTYPERKVALMTTDGFLYPNAELIRRGILGRKGFPDSYDMPRLLDFMQRIKTRKGPVSYPVYSHQVYDVLVGQEAVMEDPDILIVEGINVLQLPQNQKLYVSDFFDVSIYIDANPVHIQRWYMERFELLLDLAKQDPHNYYFDLSQKPREQARQYANEAWQTINLVNLIQNIAPTRERADLILHKASNHLVDSIYVRNY